MIHKYYNSILAVLSVFTMLFVATPAMATESTGTVGTGIGVQTGVEGTVITVPTASPVADTYTSTQSVTLTATGSSSIHYRTDGTAPTCTTGTTYSGAISVSSTQTIQALSCYPNSNASTVASFAYTINSSSGGGGGSTPATTPPIIPPTIPPVIPILGAAHSAGSVVKTSDGAVWFITTEGTRRAFTSAGAFLSYGFLSWSMVVDANEADIALPIGSFIAPQDGKIVCSDRTDSYAVKGTCYLMTMGKRAAFTSGAVFTGQGFKFSRALTGDVSFMTTDANINSATAVHRAGVLVNSGGTIYLVGSSSLMGIPSQSVFTSWGYSFADTVTANTADNAMTHGGVMQSRITGQLSPQ